MNLAFLPFTQILVNLLQLPARAPPPKLTQVFQPNKLQSLIMPADSLSTLTLSHLKAPGGPLKPSLFIHFQKLLGLTNFHKGFTKKISTTHLFVLSQETVNKFSRRVNYSGVIR